MASTLSGELARAGGSLAVTVGNVIQSLGSGNGGLTTSFSSLGPAPISLRLKPDVSAPGEGVLSTVPGGYAIWDGTSMASPAVAGAAALLHQRHPQWTPEDIRSALALTARPDYNDPGHKVEALPLAVGSGLIDVTAADATPLLSPQASANFGLLRAPVVADGAGRAARLGVGRRQLDGLGSGPRRSDQHRGARRGLGRAAAEDHGSRGCPGRQPPGLRHAAARTQSVRIRWWGYVERPKLGASPRKRRLARHRLG